MECPFCGSKNVSQLTKVIVVIQLPPAAIDAATFTCGDCEKRWFVEGKYATQQSRSSRAANADGFDKFDKKFKNGEPKPFLFE